MTTNIFSGCELETRCPPSAALNGAQQITARLMSAVSWRSSVGGMLGCVLPLASASAIEHRRLSTTPCRLRMDARGAAGKPLALAPNSAARRGPANPAGAHRRQGGARHSPLRPHVTTARTRTGPCGPGPSQWDGVDTGRAVWQAPCCGGAGGRGRG